MNQEALPVFGVSSNINQVGRTAGGGLVGYDGLKIIESQV